MKNMLFLFAITIFSISTIAQNQYLNPQPQKISFSKYNVRPTDFHLKSSQLNQTEILLLSEILQNRQGKKYAMNVFVGTKNQSSVKKFSNNVPNHSEGYYLRIENKNIYIVGNDERGTYYGIRTLQQLLAQPELPIGEITDYPDLASRGVVEGFYGTPWSHEKRLRQLDFYGENKLNTYIYGPKDDPYHSSPNWRVAYPTSEATQIEELVSRANANHVDFVWAIHPGKDIKWNDEDRKNLLQKFEMMYQLGVRAFAVFFDDISGEGTNPTKQAELLNYLHDAFVAQKNDVKPLIMCPTEYNKSWSNPEKKYLETLGEKLYPSIEIMWTGDRVVADIDQPTLDWINSKINRKAYIWWNFPVSDYVRNHMLLGAAYGNANNIKDQMSGFVSNPMEHPEASKIAIYGVADYTWNLEKYNPDLAWKKAIENVLPQHSEALLTFASHNSDLGANGHRYRRVESVDFKPIADDFILNLKNNNNPKTKAVSSEFNKIVQASDELLNNTQSNPFLLEELRPWLLQFRLQGSLGQQVITMYEALQNNQLDAFEKSYENVKKLQKEIFDNDQSLNQNPYQPGVKTGTLVLEPLIDKTLTHLINSYNETHQKDLKLALNFNPNILYTNIKQIENQPLLQRGKTVRISPVLEYISVQKNDYLGIELEQIASVQSVQIDLGSDIKSLGNVEFSTDGKQWTTLQGNTQNTRWTCENNPENAKYIRFVIKNDKAELQLKQFEIKIK